MNDLLFDVPWWIPTILGIIGVSLLVNGNKRQVANVRNAGLAVLLLAIGWALVSYLVDTDKEKVQKQTKQFVQLTVDGDWPKFKSMMTPSAVLKVNDTVYVDTADEIAAYAELMTRQVELKSAHVSSLEVKQTGPIITAAFEVVSTQENFQPLERSTWLFKWQQTTQGWKLDELRLRSLGNESASELERIPKPNLK